jgi:hypothetical protein
MQEEEEEEEDVMICFSDVNELQRLKKHWQRHNKSQAANDRLAYS